MLVALLGAVGACDATIHDGACFHCKDHAPCSPVGSVPGRSVADCCAACVGSPECNQFTFNGGVCYLKARSGAEYAPTPCHNATSGSMPPAPPPAPTPPAPPAPLPPAPPGTHRRNVLFIAVDDLRPEIKAYGAEYMVTPHLDKLASQGTLFQRAYVQYVSDKPPKRASRR